VYCRVHYWQSDTQDAIKWFFSAGKW